MKKLTIIVGGSMSEDLEKVFSDPEYRKHSPTSTLYLTKKSLSSFLNEKGKKFFERELKEMKKNE